jgi:hypothetical protein
MKPENTYTSFDDFLLEMEDRDAAEHPIHRWLRNRGVFHLIYRLQQDGFARVAYTDVLRPIKFFFQRLTRGYDDSCTWSLDHHLAKLILPRLRMFREQPHGCPTNMSDVAFHPTVAEGEEDPEMSAWNEKLDKMIYSFDYIASGRQWGYDEAWTVEKEAAEDKKVAEGLELFGKYYRGLWN